MQIMPDRRRGQRWRGIRPPRPARLSLAMLLLLATSGLAMGQAAKGDWSLPQNQPADIRRAVPYNFKEAFPYAMMPDSSLFGTADQFLALYPESYWLEKAKTLTNENGSLAWTSSRDMMALVHMYDVTSDPRYIRWLGKWCEAAMAVRDDLSGKKDDAGRSLPGWGSSRYTEGKWRVFLVHSGLIVQPILEWAMRANRLPDWSPQDEERRQALIGRCKETLLWHDYQLEPNPPEGEAVYGSGYEEPERQYYWQPHNRQGILARDFYLLYQLTNDDSYKERSRRLYTFFKKRLELTPSDAYIWTYEPLKGAGGAPVTTCDDISHASYILDAVLPACLDGFVFDSTDLARFSRTFTKYVYWGKGVFQSSIGCGAFFSPRYMDRLYAWIPVSQGDPSIYWLLYRFILHNVEKPSPEAIAFLVAYRPKGASGLDTRAR